MTANPTVPNLVNRAVPGSVALETTLLVHGVPKSSAPSLALELDNLIRAQGAHPATVGVVAGRPTVGMTPQEVQILLDARRTMLTAEDTYIQTKNDRLAASVDLYKALGGGWAEQAGAQQPAAATTPPPPQE